MFEDQVAIVTGAGSGIGAETARLLAARGARLALVDRNAENLATVAARIATAGGESTEIVADVADAAAASRATAAILSRWGRIDVLVTPQASRLARARC